MFAAAHKMQSSAAMFARVFVFPIVCIFSGCSDIGINKTVVKLMHMHTRSSFKMHFTLTVIKK